MNPAERRPPIAESRAPTACGTQFERQVVEAFRRVVGS
jgi:hypothetical protein